jgi:hypothetical protein
MFRVNNRALSSCPVQAGGLEMGQDRRRGRCLPQTASRHRRVARFSASVRTVGGRAAAAGAAVYVSALEDGLTRIEQSGVNRIYAPSRRHKVPLDEHRLKVERDLGISSPAHGETSRVLQVASMKLRILGFAFTVAYCLSTPSVALANRSGGRHGSGGHGGWHTTSGHDGGQARRGDAPRGPTAT